MPSPYLSRIKLEKELEKRAKAIKEKREKSEKYLKEINIGLKLLNEYIDISKYQERYDKASDAFTVKDFDKALNIIEPLFQELSDETKSIIEEEEKKIDNLLSSGKIEAPAKIKANFEDAKLKISSNFAESLQIIQKINSQISSSLKDIVEKRKRKLITKVFGIKDFDWVKEEINNIKGSSLEILDTLDNIEKKIKMRVKEIINKNIKEAENLINLARSAHYNLPVDEEKKSDIEKALEVEDYHNAIKLSNEYLNSSKDSFKLFFTKLLDISNILINEGVSMGEDLSKSLEVLKKAQEAYERDDLNNAINFIKKATEEAEKIKLHKVLDLIKLSRDKLLEAKGKGIDINPYLEMIDNARNFIKIGKHKKAYDTVLSALQKIERKINLYSQLKTEISELKSTINELRGEEIILEGVEEKLESINSMLDKNPDQAEKLIDELKKLIKVNLRDIANSLYKDLSSIVKQGEEVKIDLRNILIELENTEKLLKDENYKGAIVTLRKIEGQLYENIFNAINNKLEDFKKYKNDKIETKIEELKKNIEKGEIYESLTKFKELKELLFDIEASKYEKRITELKTSMNFLKNLGEDTTKIEDYLTNAKEALKRVELKIARENLDECEALIDSLSKSLAERAYDSAKSAAEEASKMRIDLEKNGILSLLNKAAESLKNKNYQDVIKYTADINAKIKDIKDKIIRIEELKNKLFNKLTELKEKDLPTDEIENILRDINKNLEDNEFDVAEELIAKGLDRTNIIEIEGEIDSLKKEIEELGIIMKKFNFKDDYLTITEEFFIRYKERRYKDLDNIGKKCIEKLKKSIEIIFNNYLNRIEKMIKELQDIGLKIDSTPLREGKENFWSGEITKAFKLLESFENSIKKIYGEKMEFKELENRIGRLITLGSSLGIDTTTYLSSAKGIIKEENTLEKKDMLKKLANDIEGKIKGKIENIIKSVESELDRLRRRGEDILTAEAMIVKAKNAIKDKQYKDAFTLTLDAMKEIENIEMQKNTAYEILKITERKINKMRGLLPKEIIDEYKSARALFLNELYKDTITKAMDINEKLWNIERVIDLIKEKNSQIKIFIQEGKAIGIDMKNVLISLAKAKKNLQSLHYENALKFVNEAYLEASKAIENRKNIYREKYEPIIKMVIEFGLKDEFVNEMEEIEKAFANNKKLSSLEPLITSLKNKVTKEISNRLESLIKDFKEKKAFIESSPLKNKLDLDKEEKELGKLKNTPKKFVEYYNKLSEKIATTIHDILRNYLENFQHKIKKFERLGVNIADYKEKIFSLLESIEEMDYKEGLNKIENLENNFEIYIKEYSKEKTERALSMTSKYNKRKAEEFEKVIKKALQDKDYITVLKTAEDAIRYVGDYRIKVSNFNKKAVTLRDLIKYAISLGLNMDKYIKNLKDILSSSENLEKAIERMTVLENDIKKEIDELEPILNVSIENVEKSEDRYLVKLKITNEGNTDARNISITLDGSLKTENPINILGVSKNSEEKIEVVLLPGEGDKIEGKITYQRLDDREYENNILIEYSLPKSGFHIEINKEKLKCALCRGTILPGLDIVVCDNCGAVYHLPCAKRAGKCIKCGTPFNFE